MSSGIINGGVSGGTITYGSKSSAKYFKRGDVVTVGVEYFVSDGTIGAYSFKTLGTLPEGFRPSPIPGDVRVLATHDRSTSEGTYMGVDTNGGLIVGTRYNSLSDTGERLIATLTYVVYS